MVYSAQLTLKFIHIKPLHGRQNEVGVHTFKNTAHCCPLPADKYNDFIDANRLEDAGDRLKTMRKLVCIISLLIQFQQICICSRLPKFCDVLGYVSLLDT